MNGDIKEFLGIVTISVVLVLLVVKNPSGTVQVFNSGAQGTEGIISVLQGNTAPTTA